MNRVRSLAMLAVLLVPSLALAQRAPAPAELKPAQLAQMYEDVEILRRLLIKGIGGTAVLPVTTGVPWSTSNTTPHFRSTGTTSLATGWDVLTGRATVEGVYLKGQGVLFTGTMLPPREDPRPVSTRPPAAKPDSEWEQMRRRFRGEKVEQGDSGGGKKDPPLGERILAVLARNGQHFSELPADESITVVLTFRSEGVRVDPYVSGTGYALPPVVGQSTTKPPETTAERAARDHELLADLHVKNKRYDQAIDAYLAALKSLGVDTSKPIDDGGRTSSSAVSALEKLSQALIAAGKTEDARRALERLAEIQKAARTGSAKSTPVVGGLPARLIVSAPKRLLDQAGQEKISFEEFKKAATVEYLTFPAAEKPAR